jgi:hypothetical protein
VGEVSRTQENINLVSPQWLRQPEFANQTFYPLTASTQVRGRQRQLPRMHLSPALYEFVVCVH